MKESKAVYVTKRHIRQNLLHKEYQLYANEVVNSIDVNKFKLTNDVGIQYDSRRDNKYYTKNILSPRRRIDYNYDLRYFSPIPKQIYTYHRSRSYTDIGVGSVKALQKRKVKRIYLPETDDRGVGSSDLSSFIHRIQSLQNKSKTKYYRIAQSYYDIKRTSSKCVGGAIDNRPECLVSAKVSPIIHTRSATTSPQNTDSREKRLEKKENKEIATASSQIIQKQLVSTDTQFEEPQEEFIEPIVVDEVPNEEETQTPKVATHEVKESMLSFKPMIEEIIRNKSAIVEPLKGSFSSDSFEQHVHNLEQPSEQQDTTENKMEREYRRIFATVSKDEKQERVSEGKSIPQKSTSLFRRRFTALRKSLGKKDSKNNMGAEEASIASVKDVSITSDPPSLEERSFSSMNGRPSSKRKSQRKYSYKQSYTGRNSSKTWKSTPIESEYAQGVKGMFKLWGKKFNLEDDIKDDNKDETEQPSSIVSKPKDRGEEIVKKITEAEEETDEEKTIEKDNKKEGKKFFFFKRRQSKNKSKNEVYKSKKGVTTGRCEIRDGLSLRMGAAHPSTPKTPNRTIVKNRKSTTVDKYEDLIRAAWLMKYLSNPKESRNSVKIRWNNKTYATSSSTIFELYKNVYKSPGTVLHSKSEVTTEISSAYSYDKASYGQNVQAWMIPRTITDFQPVAYIIRSKNKPSMITKTKSLPKNKSIEVTISDQKWCIEKSKAFAHNIEVVLHSKNFGHFHKADDTGYIRIDIPKGYFSHTTSSDDAQQGHSSDEEVYNIVEYESLNCNTERKQMQTVANVSNSGDHDLESESIQVSISVMSGLGKEAKIIETVIKRPPIHRDVVTQGSNVYIPKKCDVIGVGIITQRDVVREAGKPIIQIVEYETEDESEHSLPKKCSRNSEFAKTYLQESYRQWQPLAIDMFSWCVSDSHIECCSDPYPKNNYNTATKSCPNIYDEFLNVVSSYSSEFFSNAPIPFYLEEKIRRVKKEKEKRKEDLANGLYRILPKDSLEVFKKRKIYAREKQNWICDDLEPYSVQSNAETGVQGKDPNKSVSHGTDGSCYSGKNKQQGILTLGNSATGVKKRLKISSDAACTIPDPISRKPDLFPNKCCSKINTRVERTEIGCLNRSRERLPSGSPLPILKVKKGLTRKFPSQTPSRQLSKSQKENAQSPSSSPPVAQKSTNISPLYNPHSSPKCPPCPRPKTPASRLDCLPKQTKRKTSLYRPQIDSLCSSSSHIHLQDKSKPISSQNNSQIKYGSAHRTSAPNDLGHSYVNPEPQNTLPCKSGDSVVTSSCSNLKQVKDKNKEVRHKSSCCNSIPPPTKSTPSRISSSPNPSPEFKNSNSDSRIKLPKKCPVDGSPCPPDCPTKPNSPPTPPLHTITPPKRLSKCQVDGGRCLPDCPTKPISPLKPPLRTIPPKSPPTCPVDGPPCPPDCPTKPNTSPKYTPTRPVEEIPRTPDYSTKPNSPPQPPVSTITPTKIPPTCPMDGAPCPPDCPLKPNSPPKPPLSTITSPKYTPTRPVEEAPRTPDYSTKPNSPPKSPVSTITPTKIPPTCPVSGAPCPPDCPTKPNSPPKPPLSKPPLSTITTPKSLPTPTRSHALPKSPSTLPEYLNTPSKYPPSPPISPNPPTKYLPSPPESPPPYPKCRYSHPKNSLPLCKYTPPPCEHSPPPCKYSPPPCKHSPPPCKHSPPPCKHSPPPCKHSPPPCKHSPPPCIHSPPPCKHSPPPCKHSPPPCEHSPPPCEHSPPSCKHSPPPCKHSPPPCEHSPPSCKHSPPPCKHSPPPPKYPSSPPKSPNPPPKYPPSPPKSPPSPPKSPNPPPKYPPSPPKSPTPLPKNQYSRLMRPTIPPKCPGGCSPNKQSPCDCFSSLQTIPPEEKSKDSLCCGKRKNTKCPKTDTLASPTSSDSSAENSLSPSISSSANKDENNCVCPQPDTNHVIRTRSAPQERLVTDGSKTIKYEPQSQPNIPKRGRFSGIFIKKHPRRDCSRPIPISKEKIARKVKGNDSLVNYENEEGCIKICDEDGKTIVERKDYSTRSKTLPVITNLYNDSEVHRISAPITINEVASAERKNNLKESKSCDSIVNVIEINFKLRVIQGDKTTEINIANEDEHNMEVAARTPEVTEKKPIKKFENLEGAKDVYIMKDEEGPEEINPKNDLNIRILIKNYKPKIDSLNEQRTVNEYSQKISKKFNTVSTGYNVDVKDVECPEACFSIHRATIDLTTSEKSKTMTPIKDNVILKKSEVRFKEGTKLSDDILSQSIDTTSKAITVSERYPSQITSFTEVSEVAPLTTTSLPIFGKRNKSESSQSTNHSAFIESKESLSKTARYTSSKSLHTSSRSISRKYRSDEGYTTTDKTGSISENLSKRAIDMTDLYKSKAQTSFTDTDDHDLSLENQTSDEPVDLLAKTSDEPTEQFTKSSEDHTDHTDYAKTSDDQLSDTKTSDIIRAEKDVKKAILKKVFDNANCYKKPKKKSRMQKLKDMLKAIQTSYTDTDIEDIAVTENELTKELTRCCQPVPMRKSDSLNNYMTVSKTGSEVKPLRPSLVNVDSILSNASEYSQDNEKPELKACLCSHIAKKLNLEGILGGGCYCKRQPEQVNQQISCNFVQELALKDYSFFAPSVECIHCQTNNSRYKSSFHCAKVISISSKKTSFTISQSEPAKELKGLSTEPLSSDQIIIEQKHTSKENNLQDIDVIDNKKDMVISEANKIDFLDKNILEKKVVALSSKSEARKKRKYQTKVSNKADVLQLYETKKAVLEIYAEKTVTDEGEHLVAKLPKFVRDTESQLYQRTMEENSYKSVYKRNFVMMCIGR